MIKENPKLIQARKEGKVPYDKIPFGVLEADAWVHAHGADKYGERNWRIDKILASTYEGAILRHLFAWASGEDMDPDSGYPHLNHIRACCAVVLDAQEHKTLIDDRKRAVSLDKKTAKKTTTSLWKEVKRFFGIKPTIIVKSGTPPLGSAFAQYNGSIGVQQQAHRRNMMDQAFRQFP